MMPSRTLVYWSILIGNFSVIKAPEQPVIITNNFNPTTTVNPTITTVTHSMSQASSYLSSSIKAWLSHLNLTPTDCHPTAITASCTSYITSNKLKSCSFFLGSIYCYICQLLWRTFYFLKHEDRWIQWNNHLPLEKLQQYENKILQQSLIQTIQHHCFNKHNPMDQLTPLITFVNEIDTEMLLLTRALNLLNALAVTKSLRLFFVSQETYQQLKQYKERLQAIKQLFLTWAAQYNSQQLKL